MAQIKDFVELTPYDETTQFRDADPEQVIANYLLTDLTATAASSLLSYFSTSGPLPGKMICGPRGVGKSHLLSLVHRLIENPSRRTKIQHQQVKTLAGRLGALLPITLYLDNDLRTPFSDALAQAVRAATHGTVSFQPSGDRSRDLTLLSESLISVTPVFLIDGVSARLRSGVKDRVRDDIEWLGAFGEIAQSGKLRVIITMDEDVPKGNNDLGIFSQNYQSEYLGMECLKELISQKLFKKTSRQRVELQALYKKVKGRLPHFYWNENDFISLFPLHPIVMDVTAELRTHTTAFSLLGFAASAGVRAAGRPLLSMIMLDEAFDRFEYELRKDSALSQAFITYDKLANSIVTTGPVASRMTTRLLLKTLFMYSLTGRGIGIHRLAESLMLVDDRVDGYSQVAAALLDVEQSAGTSVMATGDAKDRTYLIPVGDANDLESAIEGEAENIPDNDPRLLETLIGIGGRYFSDWPFSYDRQHASLVDKAVMRVLWRGAEREGVIAFDRQSNFIIEETIAGDHTEIIDSLLELDLGHHDSQPVQSTLARGTDADWEVILLPPDIAPPENSSIEGGTLYWIASEAGNRETAGSDWRYIVKLFLVAQRFSAEASRISPRLELLLGDLRARVVDRFETIYITNGSLVGQLLISPLRSQRPNQTLSGLFVSLLDPALTIKFPQHPTFGGLVTLEKIESLHRGLLCGENPSDTWVQSYAAQFAAPLSLVRMANGQYELDLESDECATSPIMLAIRKLIDGSPQGVVPLTDVTSLMRRPPFGLQAGIQRLLLSALVAGWQVELTNSAATDVLTPANLAHDMDLSRYTLLRRTATIVYSTERLSEWCSRLLGQQIWFDLSTADGRRQVREAFADWHQRWTSLDLDRRIAALPEEAPTARIGQIYYMCRRYFDRMAAAVTAMLQGRVPLEQGLTHIVDIFAGNETVFDRLAQDLIKLTEFLEWAPWATHAREFIDTADYTGNDRLELLRHDLAAFWEEPNRMLDPVDRQKMFEKAEEFIGSYQNLYIDSHDSPRRRAAFDDFTDLLHSQEWQRCQNELQARGVSERLLAVASLVNEATCHRCDSQVRTSLMSSSHCDCGFSLYAPDDLERVVSMLRRLLKEDTGSMPAQPPAGDGAILSASHPISDALQDGFNN